MEKFYYNDSEVRGFVPVEGVYKRFPTEQEYYEYLKENDHEESNDR